MTVEYITYVAVCSGGHYHAGSSPAHAKEDLLAYECDCEEEPTVVVHNLIAELPLAPAQTVKAKIDYTSKPMQP